MAKQQWHVLWVYKPTGETHEQLYLSWQNINEDVRTFSGYGICPLVITSVVTQQEENNDNETSKETEKEPSTS